jgi:hypothetical protein
MKRAYCWKGNNRPDLIAAYHKPDQGSVNDKYHDREQLETPNTSRKHNGVPAAGTMSSRTSGHASWTQRAIGADYIDAQ